MTELKLCKDCAYSKQIAPGHHNWLCMKRTTTSLITGRLRWVPCHTMRRDSIDADFEISHDPNGHPVLCGRDARWFIELLPAKQLEKKSILQKILALFR